MNTLSSIRIALTAGMVLCTTAAHGFTRIGSRWNPTSIPIGYKTNAASAPTSLGGATAVRGIVQAGFDSWAAPQCTTWRAQNAGETTLTAASAQDRENSVIWRSGTWPPELGDVSTTIGVTTPVGISGGYTIDADIQFNNVGFRWNTTGTNGGVDAQSIATHEEGHFLGLGHSTTQAAVMYPSYSNGLKRTLQSDDIAGVCTLYPSGASIPDAGAPPANDPVGTPCGGTTPCPTNYQCVSATGISPFCTRDCSTRACPTDFDCASTSLGSVCVPTQGNTSMGTGRTGDTCTGGSDCSSGICVQVTSTRAICTQVCTDDCTCPSSYTCVPTNQNVSVCGPGQNTCTTATDSGVITPRDAGTSVVDAGTSDASTMTDASGDVLTDPGPNPDAPRCGCRIPGDPRSGAGTWSSWLLGLTAAALFERRRRKH